MNYGRYEIVSELGRGAMGMVFQGHDPQIDRMVALKVLREDRLTTEDYVQRFLKEATAIGRLSHPGIVTVYDVGQDHGTIYIAMEFLEGQSMDQLVKAATLSLPEIVDVGIQIANALHYAHERGIVHRDIKPPNIMYTPEKTIKVTDFGIAHIDDPDGQQMTRAGEILGTPVYMAPEQVLGQVVDGRSDLYSLGVILYELSTGRRPFQGDNLTAVFRAITQDDPVPPEQLNSDIPAPFSQVILKSMAKDPGDRFSSGQEMATLLANCLESPQGHSFQEIENKELPVEKRSGKGTLIAVALLLIGGAIATYFFLGMPGSGKLLELGGRMVKESMAPPDVPVGGDVPIDVPSPSVSDTSSKPPYRNLKPTVTDANQGGPASALSETVETPADLSALFEDDGKGGAEQTMSPRETEPLLPPVPKYDQLKTAMLTMTTTPPGASLYIDGEYRGVTPLELQVSAMKHEVKLELQGHLGWKAQLNLSKGGNVPLSIPLLKE